MQRKTFKYPDIELYKKARNTPKGHLYTTKEISKLFGYKKLSFAFKKYIMPVDYVHPYQFWIVKDLVGVPYEELPMEYKIRGLTIDIDCIELKNKKLFLIKSNKIPFWKLKEYGGYL